MKPGHTIDCILLVDDDEVTNYINMHVLEELQIAKSIEATNSTEEALSFIKSCYLPNEQWKFLLIFLDINMPVLDGFEFMDVINAETGIPRHKLDIIILSTSVHKIDRKKAEDYNILGYITKPLTPGKIKPLLKKITKT